MLFLLCPAPHSLYQVLFLVTMHMENASSVVEVVVVRAAGQLHSLARRDIPSHRLRRSPVWIHRVVGVFFALWWIVVFLCFVLFFYIAIFFQITKGWNDKFSQIPVTQQLFYLSSEKILEVISRFPLYPVTILFMGIYIKKE